MADRRHAITQLDFFIRQVTLFADEIRNAVGQKLDVLGFKTTGRDLGEQMAFGFLLEFLQKVVVIVCDRFAGQRIQCLGKALLGETVCIRQALGQGLFHFIGKLPVRRMNLFASSLAYIKEISLFYPPVIIGGKNGKNSENPVGSNKSEKRKPKSAVYRSFWASVVYFHLRLISTKSHKREMTRNQFEGNLTRVRIPPAAPRKNLFCLLRQKRFFVKRGTENAD